jgi:hypothetical protein
MACHNMKPSELVDGVEAGLDAHFMQVGKAMKRVQPCSPPRLALDGSSVGTAIRRHSKKVSSIS